MIVEEPIGGAHRKPAEMFDRVRERITHHLGELERIDLDRLLDERYAKFRRIGTTFVDAPEQAPAAEEGRAPQSGPAPAPK